MSIFDRTAFFSKESGVKKRIPWELIAYGSSGLFISPMPISLNPFSEVDTDTDVMEVMDSMYDDDLTESIDDIVSEQMVDSENAFVAMFEGTTGYYDSNPSTEFGYPR